MKIQRVVIGQVGTPLKKPFRTALREVTFAEDVVVRVETDTGAVGWGSAHPTPVITGDTLESIISAIRDVLAPKLIGQELDSPDRLSDILDAAIARNPSPKAALDMAVYDLFGQKTGLPLWRFFGGARNELRTDITVSMNPPDEMARDAVELVASGFDTLKIKIGSGESEDLARVQAVRRAVGPKIRILLDANQGWSPQEAVRTISALERLEIGMELVEQPVKARDLAGLTFVTENVRTNILADESVASPADARALLSMHGADMINVKLMKAGGLCNASRIADEAEKAGVVCMMGCMLESLVSVTAAAHLAAGRRVFRYIDLDPPFLVVSNPVRGGITFHRNILKLPSSPGLGIEAVEGLRVI